MNFIKRAWLYILRKKGKSFTLFIILLMISTFVLTALSLSKASIQAQEDLRKSLGGNFILGFNYQEDNPYLKVEEIEGGMIMYSSQQITPSLVKQIREINGVNQCCATVDTLMPFLRFNLFEGTTPIQKEYENYTKVIGTWKSEELSYFTSGKIKLIEGRHLQPEDENKGIISKDLADKNGIKIGDKLHNEKGIDIEIIGLFSPKALEGIQDRVATYDKIQNLIIADLSTLIAYENGPAVQGFNELMVATDDPKDMNMVISKIKDIKGVDWRGFSILTNNESYENAATSLHQIDSLMSSILIVVFIVSTVILSLILTMWARTRIHETGILLSLGISKLSIIKQYIAEVFIIALLAFSLSYATSSTIANQVGTFLQNKQVEESEEAQGSRNGVSTGSTDIQEIRAPELIVHVEAEEMPLLFIIGFTIIVISVGVSSISLMRLKPKEILTKMS